MKNERDYKWREVQLEQWRWANTPESDGLREKSRTDVASAADSDVSKEIHRVVQLMLREALTAQQHRVVELYFFEGRTQVEVARALGVSQATVSLHIYGKKRGKVKVGGALKNLQKAINRAAKRSGDTETRTAKIIRLLDKYLSQPTMGGRIRGLMAELTSDRIPAANHKK